MTAGFEQLVADALAAPVEGWDFAWLVGRSQGGQPSWSYRDLARSQLDRASSLLDVDTGGGELLSDLAPLPAHAVASEAWAPNVKVAADRLAPLGVIVRQSTGPLPADDDEFDLVLNRHGACDAVELARVLRPGGMLLTQQVGSDDCASLNTALGAPPAYPAGSWDAAVAGAALTAAGFTLVEVREEHPELTFTDVGALVFQLRMVPWQVPDFTVARYDEALRRLHALGPIVTHAHRFLILASR
ncbi:class I SAM-dependent methyltransferase [Dactylosporangium siamense]|uniref:Methyltransferase type 11 n=1 Tax=Dactylosporangium siamense TaxID=685454 RepID=A0A919UGB6_9ACTN|nr:methyltransferase domain-containing protein [Dactylosporangium siamense]GIG51116.1 methyltransferase type 11 [Dactylosporangium siamense]